ncbi:hypothetical protein [Erysipelothrix aquatica]|uniref:hypothetical protein n=1 Tax=Erysipelothrix aquatica TaxID=2683714 RepID=UPI00135C6CF2|nr:hypothetical protein [Erysipelothrix aquatica]
MTQNEIDTVLQLSFLKCKIKTIQLNDRDKYGNLFDSISSKFEGFADVPIFTLGIDKKYKYH